MMLSNVCLSVAYIGPKLRTERPRKTKIGTEVAHVTCDSDTIFKVKRSRSQGWGHIVAASHLQRVTIIVMIGSRVTIFDLVPTPRCTRYTTMTTTTTTTTTATLVLTAGFHDNVGKPVPQCHTGLYFAAAGGNGGGSCDNRNF